VADAGETLAQADIRAVTGVTVVAIEQTADRRTDLDPDVRPGR
jgi:K+/H+ antiporter YhaU regulatory subunit KhtT